MNDQKETCVDFLDWLFFGDNTFEPFCPSDSLLQWISSFEANSRDRAFVSLQKRLVQQLDFVFFGEESSQDDYASATKRDVGW